MEVIQNAERALNWIVSNPKYKIKGLVIGDLTVFCRVVGLNIVPIRQALIKCDVCEYQGWTFVRENESDLREYLQDMGVPLTTQYISGKWIRPIDPEKWTSLDKGFDSILRQCEQLKQAEKATNKEGNEEGIARTS